jgi:integrase
MLKAREHGKLSDNIFSKRSTRSPLNQGEAEPKIKEQVDRISKTFNRVVDALNLNKDITDARQKVVYHTLRHTYASWLAQDGVNLFTIKELLGHSQISMAERYSHLQPGTFQSAVKVLEQGVATARQREVDRVQAEQDQQTGQVVNFIK